MLKSFTVEDLTITLRMSIISLIHKKAIEIKIKIIEPFFSICINQTTSNNYPKTYLTLTNQRMLKEDILDITQDSGHF